MRLATFNVENLFDRARALNGEWEAGRPVLAAFAAASAILGQLAYSDADKAELARLLIALGLERADTAPFVTLRRNRGALIRRPRGGGLIVLADGRADWVGSLELRDEPTNADALRNTARVIADVAADVLAIVEVESRPVLESFNRAVLPAVGGAPYPHVRVMDGNDERGIDVGLMAREGYAPGCVVSHVDDRRADGQPIFSRDCAEYHLATPGGAGLLVLVNHFKSKGYGGQASSDARRRAQAERVAAIYRARRDTGCERIAVVGDLNDTPEAAPLAPLVAGTDLRDASAHPTFDDGGYPGSFGSGGAKGKIDYLLLSPALFGRVTGGGYWRRGLWPGVRPPRWPVYPTLTREVEAASDHAAMWVDLQIA